MNKVIVSGNIGSDGELRATEGGSEVLKFSIASNEKWVDKDGARQERVEWVRCVMFGKRAGSVSQYVTKGTRLLVEGKLRTSTFEKDGDKRYSTEVVVDNLEFLGGGRRPGEASEETEPPPAGTTEDIPF